MRILKLHDIGDDVKQLQRDLNLYYERPSFQDLFKKELIKKGLYPKHFKPLDIDGKYGPVTEAAVRAFQIDKKLRYVDGRAGPETMSALYPYAVHRTLVSVVPVPTPAPQQANVAPGSAPSLPTTVRSFPGIHSPLPVPHVIVPPAPSVPGAQTKTASFQLKALGSYNDQLNSPNYLSLNVDIMALLIVPPHTNLKMGPDLGVAGALSDGGKNSATLWWAVTWWPALFEHKQWHFLGLSAKAGLGLTWQPPKSPLPNANLNLAITGKWDIDKHGDRVLSLYWQGFNSDSLTLKGTTVTGSMGAGGAVGLAWTF